jgi:hypothetical protein
MKIYWPKSVCGAEVKSMDDVEEKPAPRVETK